MRRFIIALLAVFLLAGCTTFKEKEATPTPQRAAPTPNVTATGVAMQATAVMQALVNSEATVAAMESKPTPQPVQVVVTATPVAVAQPPTPTLEPTTATEEEVAASLTGDTGAATEPQIVYTEDGAWRVKHSQDGSYGPELGRSRPGYGASFDEVMTVVGFELTFPTANGEVVLGGGCQQAIVPPQTYCKNCGGTDWGFVGWNFNLTETNAINEMAVLSWELAKQQVGWESCPSLTDAELLDHLMVVEQDGQFVKLTPWREWRRATGENAVLMIAPGDTFWGWHFGLGNSQDNVCDGGNCYIVRSPTWGWGGGGVINSTWSGEPPTGTQEVLQEKIDAIMATLPRE